MRRYKMLGCMGLMGLAVLGATIDETQAEPPFKGFNNVNNIDINIILSGIGQAGGALQGGGFNAVPPNPVIADPFVPVAPVAGGVPNQNPFVQPGAGQVQGGGVQNQTKGKGKGAQMAQGQGKGKGGGQAGPGGQGKGAGGQAAQAKGKGGADGGQAKGGKQGPAFAQNLGALGGRPQIGAQAPQAGRGGFGPAQVGAVGGRGKGR